VSRRLLADALRVADAVSIVGSGGIAFLAYVVAVLHAEGLNAYYLAVTAAAAGAYVGIAYGQHGYRYDKLGDLAYTTRHALTALGIMAICWLFLAFLTKTTELWSRGWIVLWLFLSALSLIGLRVCLALAVAHWRDTQRWQDRIVIVGATEIAEQLARDIGALGAGDAEIVGVFDERQGDRPINSALGKLPIIGDVDALLKFTRDHHVDCVVVALPWTSEERILRLTERLAVMPVNIHIAFPTQRLHRQFRAWESAYGVPLMQIGSKPLTDRQVLAKRIEDVVLTSLIVLCVSPVLLLAALAIKIESRGPILFKQPRNGFNDTVFNIYKLRTMHLDRGDASGVSRTVKNDARVTRIGRVLRRWSIDELPQLFNVLIGDMSLIGPRPHPVGMKAATAEYRAVVANYAARHRMKPGITGWAQVAGYRGEASTVEMAQKRVQFDLEYIAKWSLLFDLRILLLTATTVISGKGAY
jgi:Undecaprenyl-phosphate glucose phosphotransferase